MSSDAPTDAHDDPLAVVAAWRARGAERFDPVRLHFIETLAKRTAVQGGEARRLLDERLRQLLSAYGEDFEKAVPEAVAAVAQPLPRGALAELVEHIARQSPLPEEAPAPSGAVPIRAGAANSAAAPAELKTMRYFRGTWSRLSADRRLTQSLAKMPENAGPLNSHHLVHRALILMRDLSPEYLNRFMTYVDTLLWVEQLQASQASAPAARAEGGKKSGRGKSG
ncbi:DUF2894 domain-containing protein [Variovorax sp. UC122_21]|uniref:DUF2894 domain-containing protein n=1 Tax=Variovorax sp. UC122_21 TaxID=3374554 RepID=UPI0037584351